MPIFGSFADLTFINSLDTSTRGVADLNPAAAAQAGPPLPTPHYNGYNDLPASLSTTSSSSTYKSRQRAHIADPIVASGGAPYAEASSIPAGPVRRTAAAPAHTKNVFSVSTQRWAKRLADMAAPSAPAGAGANSAGAPREVSIGVGTVYDSNAFGSNPYARVASDDAAPAPSRSHYFLSRDEILKGVANRFVHSSAYLWFYAGMALASLLTVIISLTSDCPGTLFYGLELAINLLLIAEVGIRLVAFGKQFWKSTYNVVDLGLVLLCAITLLVIFFHHECSPFRRTPSYPDDDGERRGGRSGKGEELLDSILLIGRNVVQALRLVSIVRRSGSNVTSRPTRIEIGNRPYSLDLDLEDEGAMARDRIRIGEEERAPLFDADDDEL
ncbi:hypothetical protein PANT_9c00312 [Moesziomyces antarcticus T-34]|uniref:Ion transport domain-containing protein n=1 Tax=Pseudozyma antarctica (strain T-34) TaxID=1151754 RepID=M9M1C1_PSEA3|nr:hypothetical protein PANT_9c00312 [Moesziomyces antarcticus T-34]